MTILMTMLIGIFVFVLGLCAGSFLGALIYRGHTEGKSIISGRSMCVMCGHTLGVWDLVPVLSYIVLKGRCRYCKKNISYHYLLLELLTGLLFTAVFFEFGQSVSMVLQILIGVCLMGVFFEDLLYKEISDKFIVSAGVLAITLNLINGNVSLINMVIGVLLAIAFFGGQILFSKGKWLGGGDLKFGIFMGIFLGWKLFAVATFIGYMLGAIISFILLMSGKATRKTEIAFGPMLVIGVLAAMFYGNSIIEWYLKLIQLT